MQESMLRINKYIKLKNVDYYAGAQPLVGSGGPDPPPNFAWTPPTFWTTFFMGGPILVGSAVRGKLRCVATLRGAVTVAGYITLRCCVIMITWLTYLYVITTTT